VFELADEVFDFAGADFDGGILQRSGAGERAIGRAEPGDGFGHATVEEVHGEFEDAGDAEKTFGFGWGEAAGGFSTREGARWESDQGSEFAEGDFGFRGECLKRVKGEAAAKFANEMGRGRKFEAQAGAGRDGDFC